MRREEEVQVPQRLLNRSPGRLGYAFEPFQLNGLRSFAFPVLLELLEGERHGRVKVSADGKFTLAFDVFGLQGIHRERAPAPAVDTVFAQLQPFMADPAEHRDAQVPVTERQ